MKPQEKQKANLNPIPHDLATLTKCLSIPVVLGGPPYTSPAFMITESVPKLWSHIAWEKQMQNSSQSVAFMSSWHPCRQHPSPVFLPRTTACITEALSSSNHLPLAFEPLTVLFSWFCVSNPKRQVTWEFIQVQYFLKGCGLSEVLSRSYTCENTVILFIRSDTLTTICEVLLQQSIEHVCLHTSINSPVKCSYLQSDKATTPNSILCLSYNLTIFVKSKAKKQTVKMQGVDIACILVLGSHFKTIYSSRARIIRVEIQCAI